MRDLPRRILALAACGAAGLPGVAIAAFETPLEPVQMTAQHPEISRSVSRLIEELHYSEPRLDNSLSSAILDMYLDTLDANRMYFLASDISAFSRYRYELDDRTKSGQLAPAFEIFNVFRERVRERVNYALELLETEPDFTADESFQFDRSELFWPVSDEEMKDVWRRKVKNDALSLVLADEQWADIVVTLTERYERSYTTIAQLTADDAFESFANAVTRTIDPHSTYFSPHHSDDYRIEMSLSYEGIGARLLLEGEYVEVVEVMPGGPAHIDGELKPGDRVTAVGQGTDEEPVHVVGWRIDDVVQLIRGPSGTTVRLRVLPAGAAPGSEQEKLITLVRDKIKDEARAAQKQIVDVDLDGQTYKVGVIDVPSFYQDFAARTRGEDDYVSTSRDVERLIRELESEGVVAVLMDLRQNGGGHLSEAIALSGLFIDRGPMVQLRETRGRPTVLDDPDPAQVYDGPLAVLVDRYSASASEIFAAAIQDYERGVIIGQRTFGKGSVQNPINLDRVMRGQDSGTLTLTIGKYYRVTGDSTQNRGVEPDILLPPLVPTDMVGEGVRETALPWDRIESTRYDAQPALDTAIARLQRAYSEWAGRSPDVEYLVSNAETMRESRNQTTVSLNLNQRKADREREDSERLGRENERRESLGLEPVASFEELEEIQTPERIQLELAARLTAQLARTPGSRTPSEPGRGGTAATTSALRGQ